VVAAAKSRPDHVKNKCETKLAKLTSIWLTDGISRPASRISSMCFTPLQYRCQLALVQAILGQTY
jgi:hypothetical protein